MRVALLIVAVLSAAVVAVTAQAGSPARARAQATLATGTLGSFGEAVASGDERSEDTFGLDTRGIRVGTAIVGVRTRRSGATPTAEAEATGRSVRLLDGLVTAYGAVRRVTATPGGRSYSGRVDGLQVGDRMIGATTASRRFSLPGDGGWVTVNRGSAALSVTLTKAANGFPAGTSVTIADVAASARAAVADAPDPEPTAEPEDDAADEPEAEDERRAARRERRADRRREDAAAAKRLAAGDFVFPVFGTGVSVADDYGAPRQPVIGTHQGNDIFGAFGAPVLAVADGTVQKVGTLDISGNRLWLRTDDGDRFFYAHLSAFAPAAVSGERVRAGTLLGFVGNTGDAEPTPPHVHFEIHPGGGRSIDPYSVLRAWRRADPKAGSWLARYGGEPAPGALVAVEDYIAG